MRPLLAGYHVTGAYHEVGFQGDDSGDRIIDGMAIVCAAVTAVQIRDHSDTNARPGGGELAKQDQ
jgi:hypothetical protein